MKASDTRRLRAALLAGDCAAALTILDASPPVPKGKAGAPPKPMHQKAATTARVRAPRVLLAVSVCRCTLYEDGAILCHAHETARDCTVSLAQITAHLPAIRSHEARIGLSPINHWPAFIYQAAARWKDCPTKA